MAQSKPEDMNAHKLMFRSPQEMFGMPKGYGFGGQQFPGFNNGSQFQNIDLSQAEAQAYMGENSTQAYIRQYLESKKTPNPRELGGQMPGQMQGQMNDSMQKYMANLYGMQQSPMQSNMNLQGLNGLAGYGNLGNLGNLNNLANLGNLNNPYVMDLINQARNQQLLHATESGCPNANDAEYA